MSIQPLMILPVDEPNTRLIGQVHPPDWTNPTPDGVYNLVVIGAGTAGLVSAAGAAGLGAKVALIEKHLMGGDCLNVGCVPSKALIRSARAAANARAASALGVSVSEVTVDFGAVMARMRELRAGIAPIDGAPRFRDLGVDVYLGAGRFVSRREIAVLGARLRFARAVIATGARAAVPPIAGLAEAGYLTNDDVFELTELPPRLVVIGGGPIGCELAQAFARFGSQVTLIEREPSILPRDEPDAAAVVARSLRSDGVDLRLGCNIERVSERRTVTVSDGTASDDIAADAILVAAGRRANVESLGLDIAGVEVTRHGVRVDQRLRTSNRRIYAAGDVASPYQFTHAAEAMARLVLRNALFFGRGKVGDLIIPRVTFTDPEVASVGLSASDAAGRGVGIDTFEKSFDDVDRAIVDGLTDGCVRVHVRRGSDTSVGATIVGLHAGELIAEITLAMSSGLGLGRIGSSIHAYPTAALAVRQVADQYSRTRLTPFVARLFRWILELRRR